MKKKRGQSKDKNLHAGSEPNFVDPMNPSINSVEDGLERVTEQFFESFIKREFRISVVFQFLAVCELWAFSYSERISI